MTKLERLQAERDKLIMWRNEAMKNNNLMNMYKIQEKINKKDEEIEEAKKYAPMKLLDILNGKGENVKNRVYKALLKISLAADFVNDCAVETNEVMKALGLNDFTLRADAEELCKLSQKIASFVIIPKQQVLTDMMVENEKFISRCHQAADTHLKSTPHL